MTTASRTDVGTNDRPFKRRRTDDDEDENALAPPLPDGDRAAANDRIMHPRNIYARHPPDFAALAERYTEFAPFVRISSRGIGIVDWNDPEAIRALTTTLLKHDFNVDFSMPLHHLCPPVPQRLNYIHWVADLIESIDSNEAIRGLDMSVNGTGASAIFPLLGVRTYNWKFVGTEIDPESIESARRNITVNHLEDKIEVRQVDNPKNVFRNVIQPEEKFDFCMCNPPFFSDIDQTSQNKQRICNATVNELVCEGGERAFVGTMIEESAERKSQIRWYTSMLGRKSTLRDLTALLHKPHIRATRVVTTQFAQGKQSRWGIAWTFDPSAVSSAVQLHAQSQPAAVKTRANFTHRTTDPTSLMTLLQSLYESYATEHTLIYRTIKRLDFNVKGEFTDKSSAILFTFDCNVFALCPGQYTIEIAWSKAVGSSEAIQSSKQQFTAFLAWFKTAITARSTQ